MRWNRRGDSFFIPDDELEGTMEDELRKAGLFPTVDAPVVNVERLIERHLGAVLDQHADLEQELLGETEFIPHERPVVRINRDLTDLADGQDTDVGQVGRWRATLAHEGAHLILHRILFEFADDQGILFPSQEPADAGSHRLMRCLKRDFSTLQSRDWKEIQANKGMAALLMPRPVFRVIAEQTMDRYSLARRAVDSTDPRAYDVARDIAQVVRASRQATLIRLVTLGYVAAPGQAGLLQG